MEDQPPDHEQECQKTLHLAQVRIDSKTNRFQQQDDSSFDLFACDEDQVPEFLPQQVVSPLRYSH